MASSSVPIFKLNNGLEMPAIGLGCWMGGFDAMDTVEEMVKNAVKAGYRKFDTVSARCYFSL